MYQIISSVVIISLAGWAVYKTRKNSEKWITLFDSKNLNLKSSFSQLKKVSLLNPQSFTFARSAINIISAASFLIMFVSGITNPLLLGKHVSGMLLLVHVAAAPVFTISLTLSIFLWAHQMQFDKSNLHAFNKSTSFSVRFEFWRKLSFWLFSVVTFISTSSVLLAMFPITDTFGQNFLLNLHRYSALLLLIVVVLYRLLKIKK